MRVAILGSRGIPGNYGGFETFVERLSLGMIQKGHQVIVYCSSLYIDNTSKFYNGIERVFVPALPVKSIEKFSTSCLSILHNLFRKVDIVLLIGVSPVLISWYVVLPLPDSPARPKQAPLSIEKDTPSTAFSILYFLSITPLATTGKYLIRF